MPSDVREELDLLVAPAAPPDFRERLFRRAEEQERIAARRWRTVALVSLACAIAAIGAAGVLALGSRDTATVVVHTIDKTLSCPTSIQGGVPVVRVQAHPTYHFFNNGKNFAMVAFAGLVDPTGQGLGGIADVVDGVSTAGDYCRPAKPIPLERAGLPLDAVYRNGEAGLGAMDNGAQCLVGNRITMRIQALIGVRDRPVSGTIAVRTGKKLRPVAFVRWAPKRVEVYLSPDCHA